jgi:predicted amino acid-binding ACT domain protein
MKSITIVADDKVGLLADISYILAKSKINIDAISVEVVEAAGYSCEDPGAIVIKIPDRPGEVSKITASLSKEGVKVQNTNMLAKDGSISVLSLMVDKQKRASVVLQQHLITNESSY